MNREINHTLRLVEDQPFGSLFAIFIRLEDFRLPVELSRFHYIDHFRGDWRKKLKESVSLKKKQLSNYNITPTIRDALNGIDCIQSTKIKITDISDTYECCANYIKYNINNPYWNFVNSKIASIVLGRYFNFRCDFKSDPSVIDEGIKSSLEITSEEFFLGNDCVSLRFYTYYYWSGAAHPNHHITTVNFFGDKHGLVKIESLFDNNDVTALMILNYCEKVILASLEDCDEGSFFEGYKDNADNVWKIITQYNIDQKGLTINFSPYDILPYVFGSHEVIVPWSFFEELLSEPFRELKKSIIGG